MTIQSIANQLKRSGFFSDVQICQPNSPRSDLDVVLSIPGHDMLARLGLDGFRREVSRAVPECGQQGAVWAVQPLGEHIWPREALERPRGVPRVLSHLQDTGVHRLLLEVTPDLCWFQGHFPEKPILSGVVQLHLAAVLAGHLFGLAGHPREVSRLKFQQLVIPPRILELSLEETADHQVRFRYAAEGKECSQGRLNFAGRLQ
jgi:3-hydroxymyristoyl/3-hydroxydecanoyl-(acyl carrier protein) dehydratase